MPLVTIMCPTTGRRTSTAVEMDRRTFNALPLINIHDIFVRDWARGVGIGKLLLDRIEAKARSMNGCAITLEVREDNHRARGLYRKFGFARAEVGAQRVPIEFWRKGLG